MILGIGSWGVRERLRCGVSVGSILFFLFFSFYTGACCVGCVGVMCCQWNSKNHCSFKGSVLGGRGGARRTTRQQMGQTADRPVGNGVLQGNISSSVQSQSIARIESSLRAFFGDSETISSDFLKFVDPSSIAPLRRVCKRWREYLEGNNAFWFSWFTRQGINDIRMYK